MSVQGDHRTALHIEHCLLKNCDRCSL